jgi:hypothetical protein
MLFPLEYQDSCSALPLLDELEHWQWYWSMMGAGTPSGKWHTAEGVGMSAPERM